MCDGPAAVIPAELNEVNKMSTVIETIKSPSGKILCYIRQLSDGKYKTCTGKPSDASCISWTYDNIDAARATAHDYAHQMLKFVL